MGHYAPTRSFVVFPIPPFRQCRILLAINPAPMITGAAESFFYRRLAD
jgi:hypothetical protein